MKITFLILLALQGCAFVHRHQIQNVDGDILGPGARRFEFLLSEMGVELAEGAKWVSVLSTNRNTGQAANSVAEAVALFQMGPRTGNPVYRLDFTDKLTQELSKICGGGRVSSLTFLRETNKYPVVSGEIVKVSGYCLAGTK